MTKISVEQFAIVAEKYPEKDIILDTELLFSYSEKSKQIACKLTFRFNHENKPLVILTPLCEFSIHPEDWEKFIIDGEVEIPKTLLEILAVHTVGTARGILFCKTEGTPFSRLMIPPINVRQMMED